MSYGSTTVTANIINIIYGKLIMSSNAIRSRFSERRIKEFIISTKSIYRFTILDIF